MRIPLAALALLALAVSAAAGDAQEEFEREFGPELRRLKQSPLYLRMRGLQGLARSGAPEALRILQDRYDKPRTPKEFERYLIAGFIGEYFAESQHVAALAGWSRRHRGNADAWLHFNSMLGAAREEEVEELRALVLDARANPFRRAAALEALNAAGHPAGLELVAEILGGETRARQPALRLLAESAAAGLWTHRRVRKSARFVAAARAVISLLENDEVEARTKLVIVRHLARLFDAPKLSLRAVDWLRMLDYEKARAKPAGQGPTVGGRPKFFGIEASGDRIAYVIDLSDSMATPLDEEVIKRARRAVTGPAKRTPQIPWKKVKTRIDLARFYLEQSLRELKPEMTFVIIGFGTRAKPFVSTPGMVKASPSRVGSAVAELRALRPGGKSAKRPYGKLRGDTNAHSGILLGFRARGGGFAKSHAHVDRHTFSGGCDTLYLLSDGVPTHDDFAATGPHEGQPLTDDIEAGTTYHANVKSVRYHGPYRVVPHLLREVKRLNLFRKVEIHCIAIGEAHTGMLQGMADLGLGTFLFVG